MNKEKMATYLINLRKEKGLLQQEVADIFMVTPQAVSKWEKGESVPDIETLEKISKFYNVGIEELLNGGEVKKEEIVEVSKKTKVLPIVFSSVILGLYLIFFALDFTCGFTIEGFLLNMSIYKIIFSSYYLSGNVFILLAALSLIASCVLDIVDGIMGGNNKKMHFARNLLLSISCSYFIVLPITYLCTGIDVLAGGILVLILSIAYLLCSLLLPYYKKQNQELMEKQKTVLVNVRYLVVLSIIMSFILENEGAIPGVFLLLLPIVYLALTLIEALSKKEYNFTIFYLIIYALLILFMVISMANIQTEMIVICIFGCAFTGAYCGALISKKLIKKRA